MARSMVLGLGRRAGQWAAAGLAALFLVVGKASADDKEMIEQLKARVEALEKQNQQEPGGTRGEPGKSSRKQLVCLALWVKWSTVGKRLSL